MMLSWVIDQSRDFGVDLAGKRDVPGQQCGLSAPHLYSVTAQNYYLLKLEPPNQHQANRAQLSPASGQMSGCPWGEFNLDIAQEAELS